MVWWTHQVTFGDAGFLLQCVHVRTEQLNLSQQLDVLGQTFSQFMMEHRNSCYKLPTTFQIMDLSLTGPVWSRPFYAVSFTFMNGLMGGDGDFCERDR